MGWEGVTWDDWTKAWWRESFLQRTLLKPYRPVTEQDWEDFWRSSGKFLIENPDEII
jgi:hypothetical protein